MADKKSGPAANDEAGVLLGGEHEPHSSSAPKRQVSAATFQRVTGDIGPVHLLGSPSPSAIIERHAGKALVWIENAPWGHGSRLREFIDPASPSIWQFAQIQCLKLRKLTLAEQERRERLKVIRIRERENRR